MPKRTYEATAHEYHALQKAREVLGREYKWKLKSYWGSGHYPSALQPYRAELQRLRNVGGCVWLDRFRFDA